MCAFVVLCAVFFAVRNLLTADRMNFVRRWNAPDRNWSWKKNEIESGMSFQYVQTLTFQYRIFFSLFSSDIFVYFCCYWRWCCSCYRRCRCCLLTTFSEPVSSRMRWLLDMLSSHHCLPQPPLLLFFHIKFPRSSSSSLMLVSFIFVYQINT